MYSQLEKLIHQYFFILKSYFSQEAFSRFIAVPQEELWQYHFTFGLWIRNELLEKDGLLFAQFAKRGFAHKDDMSDIIIRVFHAYCQENFPIRR